MVADHWLSLWLIHFFLFCHIQRLSSELFKYKHVMSNIFIKHFSDRGIKKKKIKLSTTGGAAMCFSLTKNSQTNFEISKSKHSSLCLSS